MFHKVGLRTALLYLVYISFFGAIASDASSGSSNAADLEQNKCPGNGYKISTEPRSACYWDITEKIVPGLKLTIVGRWNKEVLDRAGGRVTGQFCVDICGEDCAVTKPLHLKAVKASWGGELHLAALSDGDWKGSQTKEIDVDLDGTHKIEIVFHADHIVIYRNRERLAKFAYELVEDTTRKLAVYGSFITAEVSQNVEPYSIKLPNGFDPGNAITVTGHLPKDVGDVTIQIRGDETSILELTFLTDNNNNEGDVYKKARIAINDGHGREKVEEVLRYQLVVPFDYSIRILLTLSDFKIYINDVLVCADAFACTVPNYGNLPTAHTLKISEGFLLDSVNSETLGLLDLLSHQFAKTVMAPCYCSSSSRCYVVLDEDNHADGIQTCRCPVLSSGLLAGCSPTGDWINGTCECSSSGCKPVENQDNKDLQQHDRGPCICRVGSPKNCFKSEGKEKEKDFNTWENKDGYKDSKKVVLDKEQ